MNWLFIDMDSFFASVERHLRPELRHRPVGVIPVESEGTCIIAASADAKRHGIRVGTRVQEARQLCPGIALVKARPDVYVKVHKAILRSVDKHAPIHKVYSIDEWAIRLRGPDRDPAQAAAMARDIKKQLLTDFSPWMTGSIGIAPTRLLAKIASDMEKPDGLVLLDTTELPQRLEHLELDDLPGIAHSMLRRLQNANVHTIRDLWNISRHDARAIWGSVQGVEWWQGFHGHDIPEIPTRRSTITHAHMLPPEHRNDAGAHAILTRLLCKGAARLRRHEYVAHRLTVGVSGYRGTQWYRDITLEGTQETITILRAFESLWQARPWARGMHLLPPGESFSQVSMTLAGLSPISGETPSLFEETQALDTLSHAIDDINQRWGNHTIYMGTIHAYRHIMEDKIAFGRIPDDIVPV